MSVVNPQGTTVQEAAKKISGILSDRPQEATTDSPQKAEEPVNSTQEEVETPQGDTEPKPRVLKTKLGEREIEYQILSDIADDEADQLRLGSMMEQDYRRKTMSVAEKEKALKARSEKLDSSIAELEGVLSFESSWLEGDEAKELREDDPDAYLKKIESIKGKAQKYQSYKTQQQEKAAEKYKSQVEAEIKKYSEAIPEWLDETSRNDDLVKIESSLKKAGFDDQFIGTVWGTDHRFMTLLRKAALFEDIQNKSLESKRVKAVPKSVKPASSNGVLPEKTARQAKIETAKKTGKIRDAQAAIKEILGG